MLNYTTFIVRHIVNLEYMMLDEVFWKGFAWELAYMENTKDIIYDESCHYLARKYPKTR